MSKLGAEQRADFWEMCQSCELKLNVKIEIWQISMRLLVWSDLDSPCDVQVRKFIVHGFHDGTDRRDVGEWWGFFLRDAQKTKKLAIPSTEPSLLLRSNFYRI